MQPCQTWIERVGEECPYEWLHYTCVIRIEGTSIKLIQHPDSAYSSFLWPSSLILSRYLSTQVSPTDTLNIIELGAGIALPSLLQAKRTNSRILATDVSGTDNIKKEIAENKIKGNCFAEELGYGDLERTQLLLDTYFPYPKHGSRHPLDLVLCSDLFYDNHADWEAILQTIKCMWFVYLSTDILERSGSKCLMAYQERSSKRSIQFFLDELGLTARQIPLDGLRECIYDVVWVYEGEEAPVRLDGMESVFLFEIRIEAT
jgi:hypothetical protein